VFRVSMGPPACRVEEQRAALESLHAAAPSPFVSNRIPWVLGTGRAGLAVWSLERRLQGTPAPSAVAEGLAGDCLRFLCDLYAADGAGANPGSPSLDADVAAQHFPEHQEALRELGRRIERALPDSPRGFGHGDFWAGNLLVDNDSLAGVVDWPSAGPARLPLLDLLHLRANELRERAGSHLGAVVLDHLVPQARAGGHELDRAYCRQLGLKLSRRDLEALVGAYWLEELRRDLTDPDRDPQKPNGAEWRAAHLRVLDDLGRAHGIRLRS
jgi:aminoglycoside phosphotransferase (APT) family kinase protein